MIARLRLLFAVALALAPGCGPPARPLPICSAAQPQGALAISVENGAGACNEGGGVTLARASDLVVAGYTTIGPAYTFSGGGAPAHGFDLALPYATGKAAPALERQIVVLMRRNNAPAHAAMVANVVVERAFGRVHFHSTATATYQVALPVGAGQPHMRHYTFRALAGPSMGGFGASLNLFAHPERYDALAVMGADPGADLQYTAGMIYDYLYGGFCTAKDGPNMIGKLCPTTRTPLADQGELAFSFEHMVSQTGQGIGLTLNRKLYLRANRDLARALGNTAYATPTPGYLPPGVPDSTVAAAPGDACQTPVVLKRFYDWRYNPDGARDVITFCDGSDSTALGLGVFDASVPATSPSQVLLAVDVNGNGRRDSGEPVLVQGSEPFDDVGTDGLADQDEPGYDPVTNPDPSGDDYHYLYNPTGTERNWRYDPGEPFSDTGVDGVPMSTGGCQVGSAPGCYDYGEGNGTFDYAPGQAALRVLDPHTLIEALDPAALERLDVYFDAGIRDFFNTEVATNSLLATLLARGQPVRAWDSFPALVGLAPATEATFDPRQVDFSTFPRHGYVRYGDPDRSEADIEATGDGRHVGSVGQAVVRAKMLFYFLSRVWPGGDRAVADVEFGQSLVNAMFTQQSGRQTPYSVVLPPGYFAPENASKTYPVVYVGHGLGMAPKDVAQLVLLMQPLMVDDKTPEAARMQKFIAVLVDGKCQPGGDVAQAPLPTSGDLCEAGAFYTNHVDGDYRGADMLLELEALIEQTYRVRPPADVMVTD
jgi:hypothetical protein